MKKIATIILTLAFIGLLAGVAFYMAVYHGAFGHLQTKQELLNYNNAQASIVLSAEGELLGKYFSENRTNVDYAELPPHLVNALLATEDIRFFRHKGFDTRSFFRVVVKTIMLRNRSAGGGSTLTQQLAKNMYGRRNYGIITIFVNKVKEIILAKRIESTFSKQEILTLYLNTVSFGENVYGIEAAARRFFNKEVKDLKIEEGAVLIAILKANNYYNPRLYPQNARRRRNVVLAQMKKYEFLTPEEADSLMNLPLLQNYVNYEAKGPADYFLYQVKAEARDILQSVFAQSGKLWTIEEDGLVITTTLNLELQNYANQSFAEHLKLMQERLNRQYDTPSGRKAAAAVADREIKRLRMTARAADTSLMVFPDSVKKGPVTVRDSMINAVKVLQAGLIAIDPVHGDVKAWVGGIDFRTQPFDQILARRQLASTFKPVLYAAALEQGFKPCDFLDNDSITDTGIEGWSPENFDHSYGGKYSLQGALVHSMNVPTYNLYMNTDFGKLDTLWQKMGFSYTLNNYPSVPMGTAEANLEEVVIAYSVFANGGFKINPRSIISIKTSDGQVIWEDKGKQETEKILSDSTVQLMRAMLRRVVTGGTGASLGGLYGVTLPFGGKTGTSQDYADAWFTAFNPSFVIASRVGASSPSIHFSNGAYGSGSALALPLVARTLRELQKNKELSKKLISQYPGVPEYLASELDCPDYRELTFFEEVIDIFRNVKRPHPKESVIIPKTERPGRSDTTAPSPEKKKSFFRRLFEKKK
ncbi:MAG TPA: transglycosylase domain-containing protein [Bacteroidales bacterium]|nr:transglycosylase domain-containing protein [Bacteroidales bacterium]